MERVKSKRRTPELTPRLSLFGPPLLIEGEDAATYDELLGPYARSGKAGRCYR
jgi:hypothetical protein